MYVSWVDNEGKVPFFDVLLCVILSTTPMQQAYNQLWSPLLLLNHFLSHPLSHTYRPTQRHAPSLKLNQVWSSYFLLVVCKFKFKVRCWSNRKLVYEEVKLLTFQVSSQAVIFWASGFPGAPHKLALLKKGKIRSETPQAGVSVAGSPHFLAHINVLTPPNMS